LKCMMVVVCVMGSESPFKAIPIAYAMFRPPLSRVK
jgi:hypothetical protein